MPPNRTRAAHARRLIGELRAAVATARTHLANRDEAIAEGQRGFYLEFAVPADQREALDSLENRPKKIELVAVRPPPEPDGLLSATVFVPETAADFFSDRVAQYRDSETAKGRPKHQKLVASIETVRIGAVRSLFTDDIALYPDAGRPAWWEVWLRDGRIDAFVRVAQNFGVAFKRNLLRFPERDVVLALADEATMARLDAPTSLRVAWTAVCCEALAGDVGHLSSAHQPRG